MGRIGPPIPTDNVYLIETADDLPEILSQWTLYNLRFDPGAGIGLYFSPDGTSLERLATGGGGGGVTSFEGRTGIVTALIADYAGFYVDTFNTRTGAVVPLTGDYAGFYVDSFEGRVGAVVAVQDDYESFFLVKGNFADQVVLGDVEFSGEIEMTNIFGFKLGASTELELRNSGDTSTTFIQNLGPVFQFGIAGGDFGDGVFQITPSSFAKVESPAIFIKEQSVAEVDVITFGQLWVRDDTPNTLMFTDDAGNDFTVDVTAA